MSDAPTGPVSQREWDKIGNAEDRRPLSQVFQGVRVRFDLVMEDDDQGPFLNVADADAFAEVARAKMWRQYIAFSALHAAATRLCLKAAPLLAAFREVETSVGPDQYEDALEAFAGLKHALDAHEQPRQP